MNFHDFSLTSSGACEIKAAISDNLPSICKSSGSKYFSINTFQSQYPEKPTNVSSSTRSSSIALSVTLFQSHAKSGDSNTSSSSKQLVISVNKELKEGMLPTRLNISSIWSLTKDFGVFDQIDRKSTRLNSSHVKISYAVFCLKKKKESKLSMKAYKKQFK